MSNETTVKSPRAFLPVFWSGSDFAAGETTGASLPIAGFPASIVEFPLPRIASLVTVGIVLSESVTGGFLRFELTKNGVPTGKYVDVDSGSKKIWEITPGEIVADKGDEVGILWGSSPGLTPDGTIDGVLFLEVQYA